MPLYNAHKNNQGFTMIETLAVIIIIGILSAIVAPSYLSMFNKNQVNNALDELKGALQQAQREAIRKNKACTVYLHDATTQPQIVSGCFITSNGTSTGLLGIPNGLPMKELDKVAMASELNTSSPKRIKFSFRGSTTNNGTIVIYMADGSTSKMGCLAISNGPGIIRTGIYNGSTTSISANSCTKP